MPMHETKLQFDVHAQRSLLEESVAQVLEWAKQEGVTGAAVSAQIDCGLSVQSHQGEVESVEFHKNRVLGITVYWEHAKGFASTTDLAPEALRETLRAACDIARFTEQDPCNGLPDVGEMESHPPELELYHPWTLNLSQAIELCRECDRMALASDPRIQNSESGLNTHLGVEVLGNTQGFLSGYASSSHSLHNSLMAKNEHQMQRDSEYTRSCIPNELWSIETLVQQAADKTLQRLDARRIKTQTAPVLFTPEMGRGLIRQLLGALSGHRIYKQSSFLSHDLGKPILPLWMTLSEHPHLKSAPGSAPFDNEGVRTREQDFVKNGVLQQWILDSYSARKLQQKTTGNAGGVHNVSVTSTGHDLPTLLKHMGTGLWVTELLGQGVNLLTGDYSQGASGFWVENGVVVHPVHEVTIAGHLREMLANIQAIGTDLDLRSNIRNGSILMAPMIIAGE